MTLSSPCSAAEQNEILQWCKDNEIQGRAYRVQGRLVLEIPDPEQRMFFLLRWSR